MIKYSDKVRQDALDAYRNEGIKIACERYHMPSSTIYRWLSIEKREALLAHVAQESGDATPVATENKEENSSTIPGKAAEPTQEDDATAPEEDVPDMMTLLIAENEKLRTMNFQLRKALQALVL